VPAFTSGSTAEPLRFALDRDHTIRTKALVWRHWRWCGLENHHRIAVFRGSLVDRFGEARPHLHRTWGNEVHFSTFHMTEEVVATYVEEINRLRPGLIRGYPASVALIARHAMERGRALHRPVAVHTSSEILSAEQRAVIERAFACPVFDWYSQGECVAAAGECEVHRGLHLLPEYGVTELLPTGGDGVHRIVGTSLWNYAMPFIRYETEDLARPHEGRCACGRPQPLVAEILGRGGDVIGGINGVRLAPTSFIHYWKFHIVGDLEGIRFAQIVQTAEDAILVRLVAPRRRDNEEVLRARLTDLLGEMRVGFEYLPEIPTGDKWRFTVSRLRNAG